MSFSHEYMSRMMAIGVTVFLVALFLLSVPSNAQSQVIFVNADRNIEKGQEAMQNGDYDRAIRYLQKAARSDLSRDHRAIVQNSLCASLYFQGAYEEAASACTNAISADGDYWKAYVNRGNARKALGDVRGALSDYCEAHVLSPDHVSGAFVPQCEG